MRARLMIGLLGALSALGADKSLPNQAGNAKLSLSGTAITDRAEITALMGVDLGEGFIIVKIKASPQTLAPLRVGIDDFTLVSRKDGEKSGASGSDTGAGVRSVATCGARSTATRAGRPSGLRRSTIVTSGSGRPCTRSGNARRRYLPSSAC